jgi:hypothetical protein
LGITAQPLKLKIKVKIGAKINKPLLERVGIIISFITSFKPSAKGCSKPQNPTTSGPRRRCTDAINFRSANVK